MIFFILFLMICNLDIRLFIGRVSIVLSLLEYCPLYVLYHSECTFIFNYSEGSIYWNEMLVIVADRLNFC